MNRDPQVIDVPAQPAAASQAVQAYQPPSNPFDADPAQFALQVQQRGQNYEALISWLCSHMVLGEDIVQVHFVSKRNCDAGGPPYCSPVVNPGHWADPDLSKKGAEKICGLLGLATRFLGMEDFRRMALKGVQIKDVICDCELYGASGVAMSQGTGACNIDEVGGSLNNAMKRAAKRAHVDAVKRIAGLSGIATEMKRRMPPVDLERAQQGLPQRNAPKPAAGDAEKPRQAFSSGAVLTHCPIGKFKGKPWREVESGYLEWIIRELADKPDLVKAAAGELAKRKPGSDSTRTPSPPLSASRDYDEQNPPPFDDEIPF
jgi:hypothetical protein